MRRLRRKCRAAMHCGSMIIFKETQSIAFLQVTIIIFDYMIILDFIFYYLVIYFKNRPQTISWSTPEDRAGYALALITTSWLMAFLFFTLVYILKASNFNSAYMYGFVPIALFLMWLYQYVYVTKSRYLKFTSPKFRGTELSDNLGIIIAWLILLGSFALPFIISISNMK